MSIQWISHHSSTSRSNLRFQFRDHQIHDVMIRNLMNWHGKTQFGWVNPCQFIRFRIKLRNQSHDMSILQLLRSFSNWIRVSHRCDMISSHRIVNPGKSNSWCHDLKSIELAWIDSYWLDHSMSIQWISHRASTSRSQIKSLPCLFLNVIIMMSWSESYWIDINWFKSVESIHVNSMDLTSF